MANPNTLQAREVIDIVRRRLLADLKSADAYLDPNARRLARITLESVARNIAAELRERGYDVGEAL